MKSLKRSKCRAAYPRAATCEFSLECGFLLASLLPGSKIGIGAEIEVRRNTLVVAKNYLSNPSPVRRHSQEETDR